MNSKKEYMSELIKILSKFQRDFVTKEGYIREHYWNNGQIKSRMYKTKKGVLHRSSDEPCVIEYNDNGKITREYYYKFGKIHRENGPAIIGYCGGMRVIEFYYVNGISVSPENFKQKLEDWSIEEIWG